MARARAAKADLESRTFLEGAIYLYRRKNSKQGKWDIRLKVLGHKGYIIRSSGTANEHVAGQVCLTLLTRCLKHGAGGGGWTVLPQCQQRSSNSGCC